VDAGLSTSFPLAVQAAPRRRARRPASGWLFLSPALLLLLVLLVMPVALLIGRSFDNPDGAFADYAHVLGSATYLRIILRTLLQSGETALICALLGYPLAWKLTHAGRVMRAIILLSLLIPFWTNLLVRSYGWMVVLNPQGILNMLLMHAGLASEPLKLVYNQVGVLIGMTQIMLPYMVLPLATIMGRLDPWLLAAARSMGAGPPTAFLRVILPLTLPGLLAGIVLVFTSSLGFFVIPALLGGPRDMVVAQLIEFNINQTLNWGLASALAAILLATTLVLYLLGDRLFGLSAFWRGA
jgi:ABC-type spermidine/putrescine transport system permease subunit I